MPHLNIKVVPAADVWLSGECKNISGLTGIFSEGNTWEAFTCMQLTERRQQRSVLWNFRVMFSRKSVVKLILPLFFYVRIEVLGEEGKHKGGKKSSCSGRGGLPEKAI